MFKGVVTHTGEIPHALAPASSFGDAGARSRCRYGAQPISIVVQYSWGASSKPPEGDVVRDT